MVVTNAQPSSGTDNTLAMVARDLKYLLSEVERSKKRMDMYDLSNLEELATRREKLESYIRHWDLAFEDATASVESGDESIQTVPLFRETNEADIRKLFEDCDKATGVEPLEPPIFSVPISQVYSDTTSTDISLPVRPK